MTENLLTEEYCLSYGTGRAWHNAAANKAERNFQIYFNRRYYKRAKVTKTVIEVLENTAA